MVHLWVRQGLKFQVALPDSGSSYFKSGSSGRKIRLLKFLNCKYIFKKLQSENLTILNFVYGIRLFLSLNGGELLSGWKEALILEK